MRNATILTTLNRTLIAFCTAALLAACVEPADPLIEPVEPDAQTQAAITAGSGRNFLIVMTDDQDYPSIWRMPRLVSDVINRGALFEQFVPGLALCCPNRVSYLTGKYPHSHGVWDVTSPSGHVAFYNSRQDTSTLAVWLQRAGYRTGLFGKYLNAYPKPLTAVYVPRGWNEWHAFVDQPNYLDYMASNNGKLTFYPKVDSLYSTDVFAKMALNFMRAAMDSKTPFAAFYHPFAPHDPATPARRIPARNADSLIATPNYNEADVSDKPSWIRALPLLGAFKKSGFNIRSKYRIATLRVVDEWLGVMLDTLAARGQLANTYVIFTTDNGYHMGEHRLDWGKRTAYWEDLHLPLVIRGPGVVAGLRIRKLAQANDLPFTIATLAAAPIPAFTEGRSLVPLLSGLQPSTWRTAVSIEHKQTSTIYPQYWGVYEPPWLFVQYPATNEVELYNLTLDPWQLRSVHAQNPAVVQRLKTRSATLRACSGRSCVTAEN